MKSSKPHWSMTFQNGCLALVLYCPPKC